MQIPVTLEVHIIICEKTSNIYIYFFLYKIDNGVFGSPIVTKVATDTQKYIFSRNIIIV